MLPSVPLTHIGNCSCESCERLLDLGCNSLVDQLPSMVKALCGEDGKVKGGGEGRKEKSRWGWGEEGSNCIEKDFDVVYCLYYYVDHG